MQLPSNTLLQGGKYKIVRFISAGGFGCTYEAEHVLLHKKVAIKEFFVKDFCNRDETTSEVSVGITSKTALVAKLKRKFLEEAQSLCALEHPNIVRVFDVFEENGTAYYVMDYINGPSLNDVIKKNGPMNEKEAVKYITQVADALRFVHSQNRLHLDIKPGNIMIDEQDKAILIDFGASKQYDEEEGENTSTLLGKTPGYAPLEQMGNDVVKFLPSTDIYSLGATLYKLLTGVTPPSASLLASGETLEEMPASISENTRNAVIMSMQINKMKRPQSVDEFIKVLSDGKEKRFATDNESTITGDVDDESTILVGRSTNTATSKRKNTVETSPKKKQKESETPLDDSGNNPEEALPKEKFGFWLNLFLFIICYCGLGSIIAPFIHWDYFDQNRELVGYGLIFFGILQTLLAIITVNAFRKRNGDAVFLAKLCTIIICVGDFLYSVSDCEEAIGIKVYAPFVRGLVIAIIWFVYLCVSKRVEAVIPSYCRKVYKKDYIICAVFAILAIYLFVISNIATQASTTQVANEITSEPTEKTKKVTNIVFQDKNGVAFTYSGDVIDGKPEGNGTGSYPYGTYTGEYQQGLRQGKGKFESKDGSNKFEGTFENDSYAEGTLQSLGMTFKGTFENEQPYNGTWYDANNKEYSKIKRGQSN